MRKCGLLPKKVLENQNLLKHDFSGYWSRRIDRENRLVYLFDDDFVGIIQAKGHYSRPPDESEVKEAEPDDNNANQG